MRGLGLGLGLAYVPNHKWRVGGAARKDALQVDVVQQSRSRYHALPPCRKQPWA